MPKPLPLIALGAFLAVDVALVALVYQHVNQEPPSSDLGATSAEASPTELKVVRAGAEKMSDD